MCSCHKSLLNKIPRQLFLIALLCALIYLPSLWNGFIWDDDTNLYKSLWIQGGGLKLIWFSNQMYQYYPVNFTTFWLEHKLWGLNPFGYHAVNLSLHILNAILVFWVVRKLYARLALPVALLFAIHPIQVETVAWITERKNLLSLFFFLWALLAYLRFDRTRIFKYYLFTAALFVLALLSKSIAVCFIFFPIFYKWWEDGRVGLREIKLSLVFIAIGLLSALHALYLEFYHVGAQGRDFSLNLLQRLILSGRIIFFYIYKLTFPFKFIFFYPPWTIAVNVWWQWLFSLAAVFLLFILFFYKKALGRGALTLFIFYIISIFPVLSFLNVYGMRFSYVADHFSYLSAPILLLLICASIAFFLDKLKNKIQALSTPAYRFLGRGIIGLAIVYMCIESMALTRNYQNEFILWKNLLKENPKAWIAYNNLATAYANAGEIERALPLYNKAIEIKPDYAEALDNLGTAYTKMGRNEEALALYKGMAVNPDFTRSPIVHYKLGNLYLKISRNEDAVIEYKKAIELCAKAKQYDSIAKEASYNLGNAYYGIGRKQEATKAYKEAIQTGPGNVEALNNLASVFVEAGQINKAIDLWEKAVQMDPEFATAHFNLAVFYFRDKKYDLAIEHCDKAIALGRKIDPKFLKLLKPYRK